MKLVILIGAGAVGKMTVGQELVKITDLRLYHNHMDIELVIEVFGKLVRGVGARIREVIFEEFAKSDLYGLISHICGRSTVSQIGITLKG